MSNPVKYPKYQDYAIRDGKLIGEFEQMYKDYEDPWEQTTREEWMSEKAIAINIIKKLGAKRVIDLGCGFGDFTQKIAATGATVLGVDISETAIKKARMRYPHVHFAVGDILDYAMYEAFQPDVVMMAGITWYILPQLDEFLAYVKNKFPHTYIINLSPIYPVGVQKYGADKFTDLKGMMDYFGLKYLEWGEIGCSESNDKRIYFVGRARNEKV